MTRQKGGRLEVLPLYGLPTLSQTNLRGTFSRVLWIENHDERKVEDFFSILQLIYHYARMKR